MRIVICDDHRLLAEALKTMIERAGHTVVAIAVTPAGGLLAVERHRPDVLLLDLTFPEGDPLATARDVVARHPGTRVVVLTGSESVGPLHDALTIGVAGYLRKDQQIDHLVAILERCTRGEQVVDEVVMQRLTRSVRERKEHRTLLGDLTKREREVGDLLTEGLNTAQMVERLGISECTVRTHVQGILGKLGVHSRVEAVPLLDGRRPGASRAVR
jgi:two-component system nitrate/nitrite response regulator NarL